MSLYIKNLVGVVKLRILRWEDNPGLLLGLSVITRVVIRGRVEGQSQWQ